MMQNGVISTTTGTLTRLCALDHVFEATGTVTIVVKRGGVDQPITLPIQAVDAELMQALSKPYQPKVPRLSQKIDGVWVKVVDTADPDYQERLGEYNRVQSYVLVLLALAIDIVDDKEQVVWSADNTIHDLPKARDVLKRMGFVDAQLLPIIRAVQELTQAVEDQVSQD
jgi:hypothetical protein